MTEDLEKVWPTLEFRTYNPSPMPQTSTNQSQHETRPKNATAHPGAPQLAGKRKRRTKAQIEADNKAAAEAKAAEEAKKLAGMKKIANRTDCSNRQRGR